MVTVMDAGVKTNVDFSTSASISTRQVSLIYPVIGESRKTNSIIVGDTTVIKRGCGATNICEVQKSHGHYYQFACNTCNTDLCNTGVGIVDATTSPTLFWPLTFITGNSGSNSNSGGGSGSGGRNSYAQYKQQALEYSRQVREIRRKLLDWEHEFDEWHHQFDHHSSGRVPPPPAPNFC